MAVNDGKPKRQRKPRPKPEPSFNQRIVLLEREINKLAKWVRAYKKLYAPPKPKRSQKNTKKPTSQSDKTPKST